MAACFWDIRLHQCCFWKAVVAGPEGSEAESRRPQVPGTGSCQASSLAMKWAITESAEVVVPSREKRPFQRCCKGGNLLLNIFSGDGGGRRNVEPTRLVETWDGRLTHESCPMANRKRSVKSVVTKWCYTDCRAWDCVRCLSRRTEQLHKSLWFVGTRGSPGIPGGCSTSLQPNLGTVSSTGLAPHPRPFLPFRYNQIRCHSQPGGGGDPLMGDAMSSHTAAQHLKGWDLV